MGLLFALAGPAAAGALAGWGLLCLGLGLVWATAFLGLLFRSRVLASLSTGCWVLVTVLFRPWDAFLPTAPSDWEGAELLDDFRLLAWLWAGATLGVMTVCLDTLRRTACDSLQSSC